MGPTRLGERKKLGSSEMVVKKEERGAKGEEEGEEEEERGSFRWHTSSIAYKIHGSYSAHSHIIIQS